MIKKAIIPAAGRGTRVARIRGDRPKECLEVAGLPMISLSLLELALSGLDEVAVVVSPGKTELISILRDPPPFPSPALISRLYPVPPSGDVRSRWPRVAVFEQPEPRGVIDALARARIYLEAQPFALVMPDNLLAGDRPPTDALGEVHARTGSPVLGMTRIHRSEASRLGNTGRVETEPLDAPVRRILALQDKGTGAFEFPEGSDSALRAVGRSIVPPSFADLAPGGSGPPAGDSRVPGPEVDDVPRFQRLVREGRLLGVELRVSVHDLGQVDGLEAARRLLG